MRDQHETPVGETTLDQELDYTLREFHPDIRRIGRRYLPTATLHGELLVRTYDALEARERESATSSAATDPVDAAVGVELVRAYGLTRELPAREDAEAEGGTEATPSSLLAGDRFLSTSFDRIGRETASTRRITVGIGTASTAVRRFCAIRSDDGTDDEGGRAGGGDAPVRPGDGEDGVDSVDLVTPALTGVLAVDLAAGLARGSSSAPDPVRAAGASIGVAIACRRLGWGSDPCRGRSAAPGWSRDGSNPYRVLGGDDPRFERLATDHLADARRALETASPSVPESFDGYLDRIGSVRSEPV